MSNDVTSPETQRDALRIKIEAAERRIAERTLAETVEEAAHATTEYVKANPLKVVGGAIAAGVVVGLMTKPGRRAAVSAATSAKGAVAGVTSGAASNVTKAARKRTSQFGALIADAVIAYGIRMIDEAMDTAQKGQDKLEDIGDAASSTARDLRREASYIAASASDKSRDAARRTRRRATRAVRDLTKRVTN